MAFFRKLFRGDDAPEAAQGRAEGEPGAPDDRQPSPPDEEQPAAEGQPLAEEQPAAEDQSPAAEQPAATPADNWWASSPADETAPPTSQAAVVHHEQVPGEPGPAADDEETAPHSVLEIEQARARMEAEQAAHESDRSEAPIEGTRQLDEDSAPAVSARRSAQGLAAAAVRDIGRVRELNQDSVFALITSLPREGSDLSVGLFIVADGMGGHDGGEVASRLAVRTVVYHVLSQLVLPALDDSMEMALQPLMVAAVQSANETIWEYARSTGSDMGTTCTAALLIGQSVYLAHVGDSRAYLYEPGGLRQLSSDHSTVGRLIQLGQLDPSEAREHPLRNQLYRTVGQQPQTQVDFVYQSIGAGTHLLLCSDGLWGLVDERQMEQALKRSPWPQDACHELIALANLAGGDDNISAVVVSLPIAER